MSLIREILVLGDAVGNDFKHIVELSENRTISILVKNCRGGALLLLGINHGKLDTLDPVIVTVNFPRAYLTIAGSLVPPDVNFRFDTKFLPTSVRDEDDFIMLEADRIHRSSSRLISLGPIYDFLDEL